MKAFTIPANEAYEKVFLEEEWELIEETIVDTSRWSVHYEGIVRVPTDPEGIYRSVYFSRGATEHQDERPWEYDKEVTFYPVRKQQVVVEEWVGVKDE